MEAILIPMKRLDEAKRRLAALLAPQDIRRLGLSMLADVLRATDKWSTRFVVTGDRDAEAVGIAFGCTLVADPGEGLNAAVSAGTVEALESGANCLLVLPSDVPLVTTDDLTRLFSADVQVAIARSPDGGTNALLLTPPAAIPPHFGPHSAEAHARAARDVGLEAEIFELSSLSLDVDDPRGLESLARSEAERESVRVARQLLAR